MDDISIDRLILEIPGLDAEQGRELARRIGEQLAAADAGPGDYQTLSITLDPATPHDRLATAVTAALLRLIG